MVAVFAARLVGLALFLMTPSIAMAQANAIFVSGTGNDANTCFSPAEPCRDISIAVSKVAPGGTIHLLPGSYSSAIIDRAVEIVADPGATLLLSGLQCAGTGLVGLCINAPAGAVIRIKGLTINQMNFADFALPAIRFVSGGVLELDKVALIETGNQFALQFLPSSGAAELYVSDSSISHNTIGGSSGGILIRPTGTASVTAVLDNVHIENNRIGLFVDGSGTSVPSIKVDLVDSVVSGNSAQGVYAFSPTNGAPVDVTIRNSTITGQAAASGILAGAAAASGRGSVIVRFGGSNISKNAAGVLTSGPALVRSLGGNFVDANGSGNGPFTIISPE